MEFQQSLIPGTLIRRYKRFLADVELENGNIVTALCPNTGSLKSCKEPGSPVLLSESSNPKRKLKYTWELIYTNNIWVGINTGYPNILVKEAIKQGTILELQGYEKIRSEVKYGQNSRIDLLLERRTELCYVEIKNVTLIENNYALFPDAVTIRGQKHLNELMHIVKKGQRAVNLFVVQRGDTDYLIPADKIDPEYGKLLRTASKNGVEILVYQADISPQRIILSRKLPVLL
jgi:sugar fermentation stimulation protein A